MKRPLHRLPHLLATALTLTLHLTPGATARGAELDAPRTTLVAEGAKLERLATGFLFTEGPSADREGHVYFTDQPNDRIVRWDAVTRTTSDWLKPSGRANGTFFDRDGHLLACADEENQLWRISPDKKATVLIKDFSGKLLNGPNDLWIRPDGGLYFTDPLYPRPYWKRDRASQQTGQHVYYLPAGGGPPVVADAQLKQPNGIIGTPDGKTLYVADIGDSKTYVYQVQPDGTLTGRRLFCEMGSDGMTLDRSGNVYLTGRGVTVFSPEGRQLENIAIPEPWTANVTFGGSDRDLLFITAGKSIYGIRLRVKGAY